jgi:hypothetical protein
MPVQKVWLRFEERLSILWAAIRPDGFLRKK